MRFSVLDLDKTEAFKNLAIGPDKQQKKTTNINILGGTVSVTNRNRAWDKRDLSVGQIATRPQDKPVAFRPIPYHHSVSFVPGTGGGSSPFVFCAYCFSLDPKAERIQAVTTFWVRFRGSHWSCSDKVCNFLRPKQSEFEFFAQQDGFRY